MFSGSFGYNFERYPALVAPPVLLFLPFLLLLLFSLASGSTDDSRSRFFMNNFLGHGKWELKKPVLVEGQYSVPYSMKLTLVNGSGILLKEKHLPIITSVGDIGEDAYIPTKSQIINSIMEQTSELVLIKQVLINQAGIIASVINNTVYAVSRECHWQFFHGSLIEDFNTSGTCDRLKHAISISHEYSMFYAHWFVDFLPAFFVIPSNILKESVILVSTQDAFIYESLSILNINSEQIHYLHWSRPIFVEELYTVRPITCCQFNYMLLTNFRRTVVKMFDMDMVKPYVYLLYNRENTDYRVITNFKQVCAAVKEKYPAIDWKSTIPPRGFYKQLIFFNTLKVYIAVHGANFANTLFMQPGSVVGEVQVDRWVDNYLWVTSYVHVHHVVVRQMDIKWRDEGGSTTLDVSKVVLLAGSCLNLTR